MPAPSVTGRSLPLGSSFDFAGHTARPADIAPPPNMTLVLKNSRNCRIEKKNTTSLDLTLAYQEDLAANKDLTGLDVDPISSLSTYSADEITSLMNDKALVDACGPGCGFSHLATDISSAD
ncbi:hypothetical protein B0H14DRAFT_2630623 [Mycena olivaceomarginata]|nr:hypothetical protein B0H14DRAFT_2630623 [Mycena olivaceomarginata]